MAAIELNHTIVPASDPLASARFLAGILGIEVSPPVAHFTPVMLGNHVTLDYDHADRVEAHHYAFLLGEAEFGAAFRRIKDAGLTYRLVRPRSTGSWMPVTCRASLEASQAMAAAMSSASLIWSGSEPR